MATRVEDSGGTVVLSEAGATNISSVNSNMYLPQVATFASTFNASEENFVFTTASGNDEVDHATKYRSFVERVKLYDARLAFDKWIKKYSIAAATLTTHEFAGV